MRFSPGGSRNREKAVSAGRSRKAASRKRQHSVAAGGTRKVISAGESRKARSRKRQRAVADSSSTSDSEDSGDNATAGPRKRGQGVAAAGSRKAGSRKRQHNVHAAGPRKRVQGVPAGGSRKAGSRKRHHETAAGGSRKMNLHKLAKSYVATGYNLVSPAEMKKIYRFLASIFPVYGSADGTCAVIVHTLTATNVKTKQMKLPRRAVPNDLALTEHVTLGFHPEVSV